MKKAIILSKRQLHKLQKSAKYENALRNLGIAQSELDDAPTITPEVSRICRALSRRTDCSSDPWYYVSLSDNVEARKVMSRFFNTPKKERNLLPIEAFCVAEKVSPMLLLDTIIIAMSKSNLRVAMVVRDASEPEVMQGTIDIALNAARTEHRLSAQTFLHRSSGLFPSPKSPNITVTQQALIAPMGAPGTPMQPVLAAKSEMAMAPAPENTIRRLSERLNSRRLPAAQVPSLPSAIEERFDNVVDAEYEDEDEA